MIVDASVLNGTSYAKASCYGMPHVGAAYGGGSVDSHERIPFARCAVCGRPATNAHHEPPKGTSPVFLLRGKLGTFALRPALIALCGSGTMGCHGKRHRGEVAFRWVWDDGEMEAAWWDGTLLSHGMIPHEHDIYRHGHWDVLLNGEKIKEIRDELRY